MALKKKLYGKKDCARRKSKKQDKRVKSVSITEPLKVLSGEHCDPRKRWPMEGRGEIGLRLDKKT